MSTVKISLTFTFSYYSNGLIKYQCPSWPSLGSITQFDDVQEFEEKMSSFLQDNIKETLNYTSSPYFMNPEELWFRQANNPLFGESTLEIPVNANLRENYNQDQTLFPVTVYYLICGKYSDFYVLWLPLLEQFVQVKRTNDAERQKKLIQDEIKKTIYSKTQGEWQDVLLEAGSITSFDVKQFTFIVDLPIAADIIRQENINASKKQSATSYNEQSCTASNKQSEDSKKKIFIPSNTGLTQVTESDCSTYSQIVGFEDEVERMYDSLTLEQPVSVLIVGDPGVGKTTLWKRFSQFASLQQTPTPCFYTTPIKLGANNSYAGFQPDARLERIVQFASKNQGVYYLGNLWELAQIGTYYNHPITVADYLIPHLEKKDLGVVVECNNEQYAELEKTRPGLIQLFDIIKIEPANSSLTNDILKQYADSYEDIYVTPEAISTISELYKKYSAYENLPGAAVQFLDLLLSKSISIGEIEVNKSNVIDFFTQQTGLPNFLLDPAIPFDKMEAKKFFTSRVIGQDGTSDNGGKDNNDINAVDTVVELLETVKSGLTRQTGPIATLLFIGPTGVGKTEMAKALAEYLYSDPRRMIRLDMSEYSDYTSADRLINGLNGGEGILTSQVRAQPFGVVLLDEFEKADPSVFDMFLQVMGEGRLTDAHGRLAVFNNCVIILTSNLGVDTFGKSSLAMMQTQQDSSQAHFTESVAKMVRPELLNRIDRIVPFSPLSKSVLRQILNLEFKSVNRRLGVRWRKLNISYDDAVIDKLVELGNSPQFGARPLRRTVEMYILHPLAEAMAKRNSNIPYDVQFSLSGKASQELADSVKPEELFRISIKAVAQESDSDSSAPAVSADQTAECLKKYRTFVERVNTVYDSYFIERLQSDVLNDEQFIHSNKMHMKEQNYRQIITDLSVRKDYLYRLYQIRKKAYSMENDLVFDYLTSKSMFSLRVSETLSPDSELSRIINEWNGLLEDMYFYKHGFKRNSKYVAYITADNPSVLLFFDLFFKALIPNDALTESCLLNWNASDIQGYLSRYSSGDTPYNWFDTRGVIHVENDKLALRKIIQTSLEERQKQKEAARKREKEQSKREKEPPKRVTAAVSSNDKSQKPELPVAPIFECLIQDYDPDIMTDIFNDAPNPLGYNTLVLETDDSHSVILLHALTGLYSLNITDEVVESKSRNRKKSEKIKKISQKSSACISLYPQEQCKDSLPNQVRMTKFEETGSRFQIRFSSGLPAVYSPGTYLTFSDSSDESMKVSFDIDSMQSFFNDYIKKYIDRNF